MKNLIWINVVEWMRLKFFQTVLYLSFLFMGFSYLLSSLSFTDNQRLIADFGLGGIEFGSIFIAAFFSTHVLNKEIERKTILVILARPIKRWKILLSYFSSLVILNFIFICLMGLVLSFFISSTIQLQSLVASLFIILLKSAVVGVFGLGISVVSRPMFAFVMSMTYWILAYSLGDILFFVEKLKSSVLIQGQKVLESIVPHFYKSNWKNYSFVKNNLNYNELGLTTIHLVLWIIVWFYISSQLFKRKEIA